MATATTRREKNFVSEKQLRIPLTPTGLLMEGDFTQNAANDGWNREPLPPVIGFTNSVYILDETSALEIGLLAQLLTLSNTATNEGAPMLCVLCKVRITDLYS